VKDQVVGQARNTLEQARNRASSSLGESKGQFASQVGTIANALRRTTEHLRSEDQQGIAGITDTLARQVDQVANYLRDKDAMAMRTDLENLARRQPALVLGGALILGLMGARFLKSSQRDRRFRGETQTYGRTQRFGDGGYDQFSGNPQFSGGFDQFSEDAEFERQSPAGGRGGYGGGGYAGA
jgi:sirohydrochlorin ferrochelatase